MSGLSIEYKDLSSPVSLSFSSAEISLLVGSFSSASE